MHFHWEADLNYSPDNEPLRFRYSMNIRTLLASMLQSIVHNSLLRQSSDRISSLHAESGSISQGSRDWFGSAEGWKTKHDESEEISPGQKWCRQRRLCFREDAENDESCHCLKTWKANEVVVLKEKALRICVLRETSSTSKRRVQHRWANEWIWWINSP